MQPHPLPKHCNPFATNPGNHTATHPCNYSPYQNTAIPLQQTRAIPLIAARACNHSSLNHPNPPPTALRPHDMQEAATFTVSINIPILPSSSRHTLSDYPRPRNKHHAHMFHARLCYCSFCSDVSRADSRNPRPILHSPLPSPSLPSPLPPSFSPAFLGDLATVLTAP